MRLKISNNGFPDSSCAFPDVCTYSTCDLVRKLEMGELYGMVWKERFRVLS